MNIAYFSHYFTPEVGAPSSRIYDLSQQWLERGHTVRVVTCYPNHPAGEYYPGYAPGRYMNEALDGIDVHRHWTYVTPNKGFVKKTLGHVTFLPSALRSSNRRLGAVDVAIGTSPTFFAAMAAGSLAKKRHVPFVMEVRDLWPAVFVELGVIRNPRVIRLLEKWELSLYRAADRIVTVTEAFRGSLIERGVPADKVVTIPNGADTDFWKPDAISDAEVAQFRREHGLEDKFVVLYIGAHGISQALKRILEAAQRLASQPQIQWVFVGEGAEKEMLVEQARTAGLNNVHFIEPVNRDGVRRFYAAADVCLVPLRDIAIFDTFIPSKMFEVLSMARPLVASVRGESADILRRSGGAVVVEPEDSAAIAEAVLRLYNNPEERAALGQQGRQFVEAHYSRRALAAAYENALQETILRYRQAHAK